MSFRSPSITVGLSPIVRRDLLHAVQVNRAFACMIPHSTHAKWFLMLGLLEQLRPRISDSRRTWIQFRRSRHQSPPSSRARRDAFGRLTTAKPALTYAMRWVAI